MGANRSMTINEEQEEDNEVKLRTKSQLPTKGKMAEMFSRSEESLKGDMETLHGDLNHIIKRVEVKVIFPP